MHARRMVSFHHTRALFMFERLRNALLRPPPPAGGVDPVVHWATGQFLHHQTSGPHQFTLSGRLHDRVFQAECHPSTRPYIEGLELRARVDLGLPPAGHVIVMSQAVKVSLEAQADRIYLDAVDSVKTTTKELPEEVRWLSMYRPVQWPGVDARFWHNYSVLTDSVDLARRWLDEDALEYLMAGNGSAATQVPILVMLRRGRCYLRLQVNPHAQGADALLALELLDHLCEVALQLATRSGALDDSLSNPG